MRKRFGQMIQLKPGKAGEYIEFHRSVWPGVISMIKNCRIHNYSIYIKDDWLFAYFEYSGNNFKEDMANMAADPETQRWWDTVKPLMEPYNLSTGDEFWANMDEIFHLD